MDADNGEVAVLTRGYQGDENGDDCPSFDNAALIVASVNAVLKVNPTTLLATTDMKIVAMCEVRGKIYVACEHAVFVHDPMKGDFDFQQMVFVEAPNDV